MRCHWEGQSHGHCDWGHLERCQREGLSHGHCDYGHLVRCQWKGLSQSICNKGHLQKCHGEALSHDYYDWIHLVRLVILCLRQVVIASVFSGRDRDGRGCATCTVVPCQLLVWWPQNTCAKLYIKSRLSADTTVKASCDRCLNWRSQMSSLYAE